MTVDHADEGPKNAAGIISSFKGFKRLNAEEAARAIRQNAVLRDFLNARVRIHKFVLTENPGSKTMPSLKNGKIRLYAKI